jgi:hypothetical protein
MRLGCFSDMLKFLEETVPDLAMALALPDHHLLSIYDPLELQRDIRDAETALSWFPDQAALDRATRIWNRGRLWNRKKVPKCHRFAKGLESLRLLTARVAELRASTVAASPRRS